MAYLTTRRPFTFQNVPNIPTLFGDIFAGASQGGTDTENTEWIPRVDISEIENGFNIRAELPGISQSDVNITVKDNVLTLKGEKHQQAEAEEKNYHRVESRYGSFQRRFTLPRGVETEAIKADFKDGVLTLSIPKPEAAQPTEIPITVNA